MKKIGCIIIAVLALWACNKTPGEPAVREPEGIAILNEGSYGYNNSTITVYDLKTREISTDVFMRANSQALGDTGQNMLVAGEDIYIAVNVSQVIYVTDRSFKIKKTIVHEIEGVGALSPRNFALAGGKVYVTYYEGYLGEIDPSDGSVRTVPVGMNPEGLACAGGKIYVANSGGYNYPVYDNTVSVVDASSFTVEKTLTVNTNPALMYADSKGKHIYLSSLGNYADVPPMVQVINVADDSVADLDYSSPSCIALAGDVLYVMCAGYDAMWKPLPGTVYRHDALNNRAEGLFTETKVDQAYKVSASGDYVFVTSSDYVNTGDIYIFGKDGSLIDKFDTQGMNPSQGIIF